MSRKTQSAHKKKSKKKESDLVALEKKIEKQRKHSSVNLFFNQFAKKISDLVGNALTFIFAMLIVIVWALLGHYFHYSDTWQLIINTGTTIVTFLMVFLIQNTQNRDTEILNLKMDELIKAQKGASNKVIDLSELSDAELKSLEKEYYKIKNKKTGL